MNTNTTLQFNDQVVPTATVNEKGSPVKPNPPRRVVATPPPLDAPQSAHPAAREAKLRQMTYGQLLLRERAHLFDTIHAEENLSAQITYFTLHALVFAAIYGLILGMYAGSWQILMVTIKIPLLLFATLCFCLPALYTFNILLGAKLSFEQTLTMLLIATYMMSLVVASLSPVLLLFIVSTTDKLFINLLNIVICAIGGAYALQLLWDGMQALAVKSGQTPDLLVLKIWSFIYIFVGTQLAWALRPFVGTKGVFVMYRAIEGNFYLSVFQMLKRVIENLF